MTAGPGNKSYVFDWMSCDKADVDVFCAMFWFHNLKDKWFNAPPAG